VGFGDPVRFRGGCTSVPNVCVCVCVCVCRYGGTIAETDTLHHKTTDDIEYANVSCCTSNDYVTRLLHL
jgi:hypothetical protein